MVYFGNEKHVAIPAISWASQNPDEIVGVAKKANARSYSMFCTDTTASVQCREDTKPFREARIKGGPDAPRCSNFVMRRIGSLVANTCLSDRHAYDF